MSYNHNLPSSSGKIFNEASLAIIMCPFQLSHHLLDGASVHRHVQSDHAGVLYIEPKHLWL